MVGKKYRVPNYLATACTEHVCQNFMQSAIEQGLPPVLWIIQFDLRGSPAGDNDPQYQVHNCHFITKQAEYLTHEDELLFTAYSTFEVTRTEFVPSPTRD